jgi:hypothetical protein
MSLVMVVVRPFWSFAATSGAGGRRAGRAGGDAGVLRDFALAAFLFRGADLLEAGATRELIEAENLGDAINYLEDGMACEVVFYNEKAISVDLPTTVVREVVYTEPAVKGDTSGKVLKPAKIATGFLISVPLFVSQGDKIEIDTRTGEYKSRTK